ncbi:MFS transporter [Candidatus Poribacteria bacterium]
MVDRSNKAAIAALAMGHAVTDLYANFRAGLLPFFKLEENLNLSNSRAGALIFAMTFSGSLCQVLYAYLGDRWNRRFFVVIGPAVAAFFMCFVAMAPSFSVLLILMLAGGMGVSAFHPHAASFVGATSGKKRGLGISVFMTVGVVGYALGPLISPALVSWSLVGPARMPFFCVFGFAASFLLYKYATMEEKHYETHKSVNILNIIRPHTRPLALLSIIVMLRATVSMVFTEFTSLLMAQRGFSLVVGGGTISIFLFPNAAGTLLGGYLYDKISRRKLLIFSLAISSPILLAVVHTHGAAFIVLLILAGVMIGCSNPIPLAISQELVPQGASTASSIMMGLSWGIAGLPVWFFARLSDSFGDNVVPAMSIAAVLPILAVIFALLLPRER